MTTRSNLNEHVLWHAFVAPATVGLYDGGHMRTYRFRGLELASASKAERVRANEQLSNALKSKGANWSWHIEARNRPVQVYERGNFDCSAAQLLDADRASQLEPLGSQYVLDHYLTLTQGPTDSAASMIADSLTTGPTQPARIRARDNFRRECDHIARQMRSGLCKVEEIDDDDVATYLHGTVSTSWHRVRAADHPILGETLGDETFAAGIGLCRLGQNYIGFLTLGGFPDHSTPHLLSSLSRRPYEFRWVSRWVGMNRSAAKRLMERREERALGSVGYLKDLVMSSLFDKKKEIASVVPKRQNREAMKHAESAAKAQERLSTRGFGYATTVFSVWDRSPRACQNKLSDLKATLQEAGMVVRDESAAQTKVWRMSLPGNRELGRRTYPVSSRACIDLSSFDAIWNGREADAQLEKTTGTRRAWMYTADPVPFRVNTDVPGGAAHAVLFGGTGGAGKSTFSNHLGLQFLGWPRAQIVSISVGRSELGPVLLSGGAVYKFGDPDSLLALQPLANVDTDWGALQASEWLQLCLEEQGIAVTPAHRAALDEMLALRAHDAPKRRTMTALVSDLVSRHEALAEALRPYTRAGRYGHIFDGDNGEAVKRTRWTMFDISKLVDMRSEVVAPAISAITNIIRSWFDGRPTLVMLDECPQYLRHQRLRTLLVQRILDTDRKNNVRALLIAQSPGQLLAFPDLMPSIKGACRSVFYGPEERAVEMAADFAHFGVSGAELEAISRLELGSYTLRNPFGTRHFKLDPGDIALTLCGMSSPDELALLERLHGECEGDLDAMLLALLKARSTRGNDLAAKARTLLGWDMSANQAAE